MHNTGPLLFLCITAFHASWNVSQGVTTSDLCQKMSHFQSQSMVRWKIGSTVYLHWISLNNTSCAHLHTPVSSGSWKLMQLLVHKICKNVPQIRYVSRGWWDVDPKTKGGGSSWRLKKKVTPTNLRVEVVSDLPVAIVATLDEFEMCPCPGENAHTMNNIAKLFKRTPSEELWIPLMTNGIQTLYYYCPHRHSHPQPHRPKLSCSAHLLLLMSLLTTAFTLT